MNPESHGAHAQIHVLVVEDDPSVSQMYRLKLELDGHHVDVAPDGLAGVEMAKALQPDIIFLDIRLPKLDGIGVLEALRADPATKDSRVVILSNWNEQELVDSGVRLGALDHLVKSQTTPGRLSSGIEDWLRR